MAVPDLTDIGTVIDIVVPAANEGDYELDSWSVKEKGSTRTLSFTLVKDLAPPEPAPAKPSDAQVEQIHRSAKAAEDLSND